MPQRFVGLSVNLYIAELFSTLRSVAGIVTCQIYALTEAEENTGTCRYPGETHADLLLHLLHGAEDRGEESARSHTAAEMQQHSNSVIHTACLLHVQRRFK